MAATLRPPPAVQRWFLIGLLVFGLALSEWGYYGHRPLYETAENDNYEAKTFLKCKAGSTAYQFRGPASRHKGFDFNCSGGGNADCGTEIRAVRGGVVTATKGQGFGLMVAIEETSNCRGIYAHLKKPIHIKVGDLVQPGQVIGRMGRSGNGQSCHFHYEPCSELYPKK